MNRIYLDGTFAKDHYFKINEKAEAFLMNTILNVEGKRKYYFSIVAYGKTAEGIANSFKKGDYIDIEGELQNNNYEKDGKIVYNNRINITAYTLKNDFPF